MLDKLNLASTEEKLIMEHSVRKYIADIRRELEIYDEDLESADISFTADNLNQGKWRIYLYRADSRGGTIDMRGADLSILSQDFAQMCSRTQGNAVLRALPAPPLTELDPPEEQPVPDGDEAQQRSTDHGSEGNT